ncbi:DUF3164 family protein [Rhizobium sp. CRIBSB]|nr:DUF3164 family protein [Rhizobium sp. CRIBSB]
MTETTMMTHCAPVPTATPPGREVLGENLYWRDAKGALIPDELVKPIDKLIDDQVRKIMGYADDLNAQISRFKQHTLDDVADLLNLLLQDYKTRIGGEKGNVQLTSYDGTLQVRLQVQERLTFGPELQAAKANVDAYMTELTEESDPVLRGLVHHAFRTDQAGLVNRAELFRLLRYEIEDARWQQAMRAIKDSIRVEGTREHVRFYRRPDARSKWTAVTIDVADA